MVNVDHGYVAHWDRWQWMEGAIEAIALAKRAGYWVFVVTNQGGIGLGLYTMDDVDRLHRQMQDTLAAQGAPIDDLRYCPHHPDAIDEDLRRACFSRKPHPGMILQLMECWPVDTDRSLMIGDKLTDMEAAKAAKIAGRRFSGGNLADFLRPLLIRA